jgi:hypothetical protein
MSCFLQQSKGRGVIFLIFKGKQAREHVIHEEEKEINLLSPVYTHNAALCNRALHGSNFLKTHLHTKYRCAPPVRHSFAAPFFILGKPARK